ncbi:TlpA family protein disulfide reductase [Falsirhodobacter xinxiangensis]|uniref:TlpA family protein disulfide reductase n=1 Tax=Falsirhodobacter xinxiangensis TaxID=2530049 RepID=UPI0010A9B8A6|nr:TlpA disulfide reductase family protein [Rhodobacter xinxiangensis]
MLRIVCAVVYTALAFGANPAMADIAAAEAAKVGDMRKLSLHDPEPLPAVGLVGLDDAERSLAEFQGKWTVVNFWATWCPPCRHEMPSLDRLQVAMPGIEVVTVATGRNAVPKIEEFFEEAEVSNVEALRDPGMTLARQVGVMGLPVTLIVNPEGQIVGRLTGDAEWDSPDALAVLGALGG